MSIRTPLARVRGLGTAKDGTQHWWMQRVTAIALVLLVAWFALSMMMYVRADYEVVQQWLAHPVNAGLMMMLLVVTFYHAHLGMQVVYEDYVHPEWLKFALLLATQFIFFLLSAISVIAVLKIALA